MLVLVSVAAPSLARAQSAPDVTIKAAFVSKFPRFVTWPPPVWEGRNSIDLCVERRSPLGPILTQLLAAEQLDGRRLLVRLIDRDDPIDACHVLVVAPAPSEVLRRAASLPILTVGDDGGFLDQGGIIQLRIVQGRVRFDISAAAAMRAGLRLSSQLLDLALTVRGGPS